MPHKLIQIENFTKSFGKQKAVNNLSFDVYQGDIFAFLGTNGSGKTTTIRCLLDIYPADSGTLLIDGQQYTPDLNNIIGYLPEERGIYVRSSVKELMLYFLELRGLRKHKALDLINEYLEKVDLKVHADKKISQLSSGMQQKVQLGVAIIHKPKLLILDEPFKGLDPVNRQLFTDMFRELKESGTTIMYSTHTIDEAQKLADRLVIIHKGERKAYGSLNDVRKTAGKNHIHLEFGGKFVGNDKLFSYKLTNHTAEIIPNKGADPEEILKFLINQNLDINFYKLDYPSLNEIFINIVDADSVRKKLASSALSGEKSK